MRQNALLDSAERAEIPPRGAYHAHYGRGEQDPEILKQGEGEAAKDHEGGSYEQDAPASKSVGHKGQGTAKEDITQDGQGHEEANARVGEVEFGKEKGFRWLSLG